MIFFWKFKVFFSLFYYFVVCIFNVKCTFNNILVNELKAALLALELAHELATSLKDPSIFCARLYLDNRAVIALINIGRARWNVATIGIFAIFNILKRIELFREFFCFTAIYIPSAGKTPGEKASIYFASLDSFLF